LRLLVIVISFGVDHSRGDVPCLCDAFQLPRLVKSIAASAVTSPRISSELSFTFPLKCSGDLFGEAID
jgi:hypothetical protein